MALLGAHHILHVSRIRVNVILRVYEHGVEYLYQYTCKCIAMDT